MRRIKVRWFDSVAIGEIVAQDATHYVVKVTLVGAKRPVRWDIRKDSDAVLELSNGRS